jgi:hypothetical protein
MRRIRACSHQRRVSRPVHRLDACGGPPTIDLLTGWSEVRRHSDRRRFVGSSNPITFGTPPPASARRCSRQDADPRNDLGVVSPAVISVSARSRLALRRRPHAGPGSGRRARRPEHAARVSRRRTPRHRFCPRGNAVIVPEVREGTNHGSQQGAERCRPPATPTPSP